MRRPTGRLAAAVGFAVAVAIATPALASAHGASGSHARIGVDNLSGGAALHPAIAFHGGTSSSVRPAAVHPFPSAASTIVGSVGFIDSEQVGYFWSANRGDSVAETLSGPGAVRKLILK